MFKFVFIAAILINCFPIQLDAHDRAADSNQRNSTVVVLFVSGSPDYQSLVDILVDDVSQELVQSDGWTIVLPLPGTMDQDTSGREIGEAQDADQILEGFVMYTRDEWRVTVQLFDPKTGMHLWSESYSVRDLSKSNVAQSIVSDIRGSIKLGASKSSE